MHLDFGSVVVLLTLVPVAITFVGCCLFMLWEDREQERFYRELNRRTK